MDGAHHDDSLFARGRSVVQYGITDPVLCGCQYLTNCYPCETLYNPLKETVAYFLYHMNLWIYHIG